MNQCAFKPDCIVILNGANEFANIIGKNFLSPIAIDFKEVSKKYKQDISKFSLFLAIGFQKIYQLIF